jgi:hypothetical protein
MTGDSTGGDKPSEESEKEKDKSQSGQSSFFKTFKKQPKRAADGLKKFLTNLKRSPR